MPPALNHHEPATSDQFDNHRADGFFASALIGLQLENTRRSVHEEVVRANEIVLYVAEGELLYRSPPSTCKVGREAPRWYARVVSSPLDPKVISLPDGRITLQADASRATLDDWDDLRPLLWMVLAGFVVANLLVYALMGRATRPLRLAVRGLRQMEAGT